MQADDLYFVIPTYRLRDVGETVEALRRAFLAERAFADH